MNGWCLLLSCKYVSAELLSTFQSRFLSWMFCFFLEFVGFSFYCLFWLFSKTPVSQTHRHREQTCSCQGGARWRRNRLAIWDSVQSLSRVRLFATASTAARQASLSITNSQSSLKLTSIESVMQQIQTITYRMDEQGLPRWHLVVKNPPANAGDIRDSGLIPGSGRSPGGGHGNPLQYSGLENAMDRGPWWPTVHRVAKSWTWLKWLSTCTHIHFIDRELYSKSYDQL